MGRSKDPIRLAALEAGEKTYEGNPCKRGHPGKRYTCGGHCYHCAYEKSPEWHARYRQQPQWKANQKKYRAAYGKDPKNKERLREIHLRWYIKKHYNNDPDLYEQVQMEKEEKRQLRRAEQEEKLMRKRLREHARDNK